MLTRLWKGKGKGDIGENETVEEEVEGGMADDGRGERGVMFQESLHQIASLGPGIVSHLTHQEAGLSPRKPALLWYGNDEEKSLVMVE